ncbi:hypothetical protein ACFFSY_21920 [Paenibacillus aurantiacus]|uniref:Uncharacterized protein n=1 Tax=Paenibacillus aurantiacus TaxID=1936118 RepID=A0ABV5KVI7_9BACL
MFHFSALIYNRFCSIREVFTSHLVSPTLPSRITRLYTSDFDHFTLGTVFIANDLLSSRLISFLHDTLAFLLPYTFLFFLSFVIRASLILACLFTMDQLHDQIVWLVERQQHRWLSFNAPIAAMPIKEGMPISRLGISI